MGWDSQGGRERYQEVAGRVLASLLKPVEKPSSTLTPVSGAARLLPVSTGWRSADSRVLPEHVVLEFISKLGPKGRDAFPAILPLLESDDTRLEAVRTLGAIGPDAKAALPALRKLQEHRDEEIRKAVQAAIKSIEK